MTRSKGLTLMELMVAVSLLGVVGLSFAFLYSSSQRFLIQSINATSAQGEASFALEHIRKNFLRATAILAPAEGVNGTTLEFTWTPAPGDAEVTSTYQLDVANDELEFRRDAGVEFTVISRWVTALDFARPVGATSITVTITSERAGGGDARETELQTVVRPWGL